MIWYSLKTSLILGWAATGSETTQNPKAQMMQTLGMLVVMGFIFYFLLIRPQQKKAKAHQALVQTLKNGDKVTTSGGVVGTVVSIKEKTVTIRSADAKFEILKSAVTEINQRADAESSS